MSRDEELVDYKNALWFIKEVMLEAGKIQSNLALKLRCSQALEACNRVYLKHNPPPMDAVKAPR